MRIAVTYENGQVFQHFGHTEEFKIYEIEDGKVISTEIIGSNGSGHSALAALLDERKIDVVRRRPSRKEASNCVPGQMEMQIRRWKRICTASLSIPGQTALTMEKDIAAMSTGAASMTAEMETATQNKRERISAKPAERITAALSTTAHSLTLLMIAENRWSLCAVPV